MAATLQSSNTANPGNGSSITVTKPTGLAVGDLMIFHYVFSDATDTANTISGWTHEISNVAIGGNRTGLQWKTADSGDVSASDFTMSFTGAVASPLAGLIRIDGHITSDLLNDSGNLQANTSSPTYTNTVTPISASSLLLFFQANNEAKTAGSYAIVTSDPTWTELYDIQNSTISGLSLAYATRPEVTATGNSSCALAGGSGTVDSYGIMVSIGSITNVTVSPNVIDLMLSVQAPAVSGGATVSPGAIVMTASVQAPTVTITANPITNIDKNNATWVNTDKT